MNQSQSNLQDCAQKLSQCLAESCSAYQSLLELEKQQSELIAAEDWEGTAEKISEKNSLMAQIEERDHHLYQAHQSWQTYRDEAPEALRTHLQEQLDQLQTVVSQLMEQQSSNEARIKAEGQTVSRKLKELQQSKQAQQSYRTKAAGDAYRRSRFYDKST